MQPFDFKKIFEKIETLTEVFSTNIFRYLFNNLYFIPHVWFFNAILLLLFPDILLHSLNTEEE